LRHLLDILRRHEADPQNAFRGFRPAAAGESRGCEDQR
jgi:hypothetical protein